MTQSGGERERANSRKNDGMAGWPGSPGVDRVLRALELLMLREEGGSGEPPEDATPEELDNLQRLRDLDEAGEFSHEAHRKMLQLHRAEQINTGGTWCG